MTRTNVNLLVDTALLLVFATLLTVGAVVRFVFPPVASTTASELWGYTYDEWVGLWFNIQAAFALLILLHVMLHWSWVCGVVSQRLSKRLGRLVRIDEANQTVYGVGLLVVLLSVAGAVVAWAALSIRSSSS